ncbi:MAG: peptidylprolyl isomerase [Candidatus Altiarchaeales archaeon ex4484_96]|nr:MAG: peptidylprolyl isomerase [Candidatus Altiarchaeales archaeon ex4484_96]
MADKRILKISYTANVKDGEIYDTTDEKKAREKGIYNEKRIYSPLTVILGENQVIEGLDKALEDMKKGEEKKVTISPEKAYGVRDSNLVRLVSLGEFKKKNITPIPGMPVELDGQHARIQTVSGGRVRVDFNHELAGKTVVFDVKVEDEAKTKKKKIDYIIERSFNSTEDFKVETIKDDVRIELPEKVYKDKNLLIRKASLSAELFKYLGVGDVVYTETWSNPQKTKEGGS